MRKRTAEPCAWVGVVEEEVEKSLEVGLPGDVARVWIAVVGCRRKLGRDGTERRIVAGEVDIDLFERARRRSKDGCRLETELRRDGRGWVVVEGQKTTKGGKQTSSSSLKGREVKGNKLESSSLERKEYQQSR